MPSLKDIRRRITSVKKTQQITRAMRMVAAAKLRRAQEAIESGRPYADRMRETLAEVAASGGDVEQPLMVARERVRRVELVVVTSDRGLCGAFNANVCKQADLALAHTETEADLEGVSLTLVGRKAAEYYHRRRADQIGKVMTGHSPVTFEQAVEIADHVSTRFLSGEVDEVYAVHSEFISTMTQRPRFVKLLPMVPEKNEEPPVVEEKLPFSMEPDASSLLNALAPRALQVEIYRALLDSQAGEHAARMTAMESATRNTEELIDSLTLQYNRARQAAITKELVEIVSGAEAL